METPDAIAATYLQRPVVIDISGSISRGWALVRDNMGVFVGATVLGWVMTVGLGCVPILGWLVGFVLIAGLDYMFLRRIRGEDVQIGDLFAGFNIAFLNLAMCGLVKWLLTTLGLIVCILPGIYLAVGYVFALPLVIDKKMEFWPAMEVSRQVVHRHWWSTFALVIVLALVAFSGFLLCGVGEVITIPIASAAFMYVYEDLFGAQTVAQSIAAVIALAMAGAAVGQPAKISSSWRQVRTPELTVSGDASESDLKQVLRDLTAFRSVLSQMFPGMRMNSPVPTSIVVFRDQDAFAPYRPRDSRGRPVGNVGGYLTLQPEANFMVFGLASQAFNYEVTFHEYTHYLVHRNARTAVPTWVDEGLADFYSTFLADYKGGTLLGGAPAQRVTSLRRLSFMPLRQLVSPRDGEEMWRSQDRVAMFYAESWALVHYLMIGRKNAAPGALTTYLNALQHAPSQDAAFREAFGVDIAGMERELHDYMFRVTYPAIKVSLDGQSVIKAAGEPMLEADAQQLRGSLLAAMDAGEAAEQPLGAALALAPSHVGAHVSLARVRLSQERPQDAIALLRDAIRDAPADIGAHYYLGRALFEDWQFDAAQSTFERATKLSQEHAHIWAGLSASALALKHDSQANAALQIAVQLEAEPEDHLRHAEDALRLGRNDAAAAAAGAYIDWLGIGEESAQYASLLGAVAASRSGDASRASAFLAATRPAVPAKSWLSSLLQFQQGELTAERLLAAAHDLTQRTDAHTVIAFKLDGNGRQEEAMTHLRWVMEQGAKNGFTRTLARNELARLRHLAE